MRPFVYLVLVVVMALGACCKKNNPPGEKGTKVTTEKPRDYTNEGYKKAIVIDMSSLDGCGFMFQLPDSTKLNPYNILADEFRVDKMKVWVKYGIKKGVMTTCMSGKNINIVDVVKRD